MCKNILLGFLFSSTLSCNAYVSIGMSQVSDLRPPKPPGNQRPLNTETVTDPSLLHLYTPPTAAPRCQLSSNTLLIAVWTLAQSLPLSFYLIITVTTAY